MCWRTTPRCPCTTTLSCNGVFNYRGSITFERMLNYWQDLLLVAYRHARLGLAFNVMSPHVDWEGTTSSTCRCDTMSAFVWSRLSRFFVVRHDHRACEYVTYVYREASGSRR